MWQTVWDFGRDAFFLIAGYLLAKWGERAHADRSVRAHIDALGMEIRYCGKLAAEYASASVAAPLYRLPDTFYQLAVPELLREGLLDGADTDALQRFYGQAAQVNRGLDIVDDLLREEENELTSSPVQTQLSRLHLKVNDMRAEGQGVPRSQMYSDVVSSQLAIFTRWQNRSAWRRFRRRHVRPHLERLRRVFRHDAVSADRTTQ
jgi:hypothetical protein